MTMESVPQAAAILLAGAGALTDAVRGKIYNKALLAGLVVAVAWLAAYGAWDALGGQTDFRRYPELGLIEPYEAPVTPDIVIGPDGGVIQLFGPDPNPLDGKRVVRGQRRYAWEETPNQSVWPPPKDHLGPDEVTEDEAARLARTEFEGRESAPLLNISRPPEPSYWVYLGRAAMNSTVALVLGFGLYLLGMWAAGDAKLFAVLAALLPLSTYRSAYWPSFPAYVLIFNTFLAMMAILVTELCVRGARQVARPTEEEAESWRQAWTWVRTHLRETAMAFVAMLFMMLIIKSVRILARDLITAFSDVTDSVMIYFLLFLLVQPLVGLMRHKWVARVVTAGVGAFVVYVAIRPTDELNLFTIVYMSLFMLGLLVFLLVYQLYLNVFDFRAIKVWELRPRMILAARTFEILKEDQDMQKTKLGDVGPDGLLPEQVETLRRWWIDRGKGRHIWVSRTIPFAPALFVGTVVTVLLGGYLLKV